MGKPDKRFNDYLVKALYDRQLSILLTTECFSDLKKLLDVSIFRRRARIRQPGELATVWVTSVWVTGVWVMGHEWTGLVS